MWAMGTEPRSSAGLARTLTPISVICIADTLQVPGKKFRNRLELPVWGSRDSWAQSGGAVPVPKGGQ